MTDHTRIDYLIEGKTLGDETTAILNHIDAVARIRKLVVEPVAEAA